MLNITISPDTKPIVSFKTASFLDAGLRLLFISIGS